MGFDKNFFIGTALVSLVITLFALLVDMVIAPEKKQCEEYPVNENNQDGKGSGFLAKALLATALLVAILILSRMAS